jgi:hypothetical protein
MIHGAPAAAAAAAANAEPAPGQTPADAREAAITGALSDVRVNAGKMLFKSIPAGNNLLAMVRAQSKVRRDQLRG